MLTALIFETVTCSMLAEQGEPDPRTMARVAPDGHTYCGACGATDHDPA